MEWKPWIVDRIMEAVAIAAILGTIVLWLFVASGVIETKAETPPWSKMETPTGLHFKELK